MAAHSQTIILHIQGMTCTSCEHHIENHLSHLAGVHAVKASFARAQAMVSYDPALVTVRQIESELVRIDYPVVKGAVPATRATTQTSRKQMPPKPQAASGHNQRDHLIGMAIILVGLFLVSRRLGLASWFNVFPQAEAGMGYGLLFIIGLLTSVHCVAMCGGINLSQCLPRVAPDQDSGASGASGSSGSRWQTVKPSLLYNMGRVVSYTVIGGIVGALGSVLVLPGRAKGLVALVAGVFMVIMGLNMLQIFPVLRKFNPRMPRALASLIYREKQRGNKGPFTVGLLNGLMPCGPLQAMQIYALSTGNPLEGALSMLLFSLGTVPLMFGLGALGSLLSRRFTRNMMQASAMLVIILGVLMFQNGLGLSGVSASALAGSIAQPASQKANGASEGQAELVDGVQLVTTELKSNRYAPITVQAGIPVRWTIHAADGTLNGCNNAIVIPAYGIEKPLEFGDNVIEFTPDESGIVPFSCWMGMIRSQITVVE